LDEWIEGEAKQKEGDTSYSRTLILFNATYIYSRTIYIHYNHIQYNIWVYNISTSFYSLYI